MSVKAKDIAKQLGISTATISLVINGKPGISDKTRKKVLKQIQELGYGDMIQSQQLPEEENKVIGFVIYKNNGELLGMNSFFPLILDGIESTARQYGYQLQIINIERKEIDTQIQYITEAHCAGIVVFATEMKEEVHYFEELGIPFVLFDNYFNEKQIDSVKVNNEQGTYLLVKYLKDLGHSKIGYLGSGLSINSFTERKRCALQAMHELGVENSDACNFEIGYPHEMAENGMETVINQHDMAEMPTAFMADNDLVAIGAMRAFMKKGYRVPEDFSIVGYDDRPICTLVDPNLTTIQLPRERFGAEAVYQLIRIIQRENKTCTKVEINGNLIIRDSVATPGK